VRGFLLVAIVGGLASSTAASGCKDKKPTYDRSTPVNMINSFRRALEAGRMPADTREFFLDPKAETRWRLKCKDKGCNRAHFEILEVVSQDDYAAKYRISFGVYGDKNRRIMHGKDIPATFAFHEGAWYFDQIGTVHRVRLGPPKKDAGPVSSKDGGEEGSKDGGAAPSKPPKEPPNKTPSKNANKPKTGPTE